MVSHSEAGDTQLQLTTSGSRGDQNELTYGIGTSYGNRNDASSEQSVIGNMGYQSSVGQLGMTASANNNASRQLSVSASGSLVAHQGGVIAAHDLAMRLLPSSMLRVPEGLKCLMAAVQRLIVMDMRWCHH